MRVLSSAPSSYLAPRRTLTTITSSVRAPPRSVAANFQRRWATNEAEAKREETETSISQGQPTPQEAAENASQSSSHAKSQASESSESVTTNEATHEAAEAPISQIQATPQEEVENAIQSDNASQSPTHAEVQASGSSESGTEQAEAQNAQGASDSIVDSVTAAASEAAETVKETVQGVYQAAAGGPRPPRPAREGSLIPKPTIYIGNLFFDVTENDLVKELARFGTIVKCRLMRDSRGLSKGYVQNGCLITY